MKQIFHPLDWIELSEKPTQLLALFAAMRTGQGGPAGPQRQVASSRLKIPVEALGVETDVTFILDDEGEKILGWEIDFPINPDEPRQGWQVGSKLCEIIAEALGEADEMGTDERLGIDASWRPIPQRRLRVVAANRKDPWLDKPWATLRFSLEVESEA